MINKFINWLKQSFEGVDNKASSRKITAFLFVVIYTVNRYYFTTNITDPMYLLYALILDVCVILILLGILTIQNIISFFQRKNNPKK